MSHIPCDMSSSDETSTDATSPPEKLTSELLTAQMKELRVVLETDLIASDAKWMLFVAAAFSHRFYNKLNPIPPLYVSESNSIKIDALLTAISKTPQLHIVLANLKEENYYDISSEVLQLLYWVLVESRGPYLRVLSQEHSNDLLDQIREAEIKIPELPTYILEVHTRHQPCFLSTTVETTSHGSNTAEEEAGNEISTPSIEFAFYGDRLDEFYSILHHGFGAVSQRQEPNFLLRDLNAALEKSPSGAGWGLSECGSLVSCVALCACINPSPQQPRGENNSQDDEEEILSGLVDVRYLILYGKRCNDISA